MVFCNTNQSNFLMANISCHNPYFNRWFSAIEVEEDGEENSEGVTILILIDGFLQYLSMCSTMILTKKSQSLF